MVSGLNLSAYWLANTISDIIKSYVPIGLIIGTSYVFDKGYQGVWALFLLYPIAMVPFTYCCSFMFSSDRKAQVFIVFLNVLIAGIMAPVVYLL